MGDDNNSAVEKREKMLKEGDIIELKEGYTVYTDIPEHLVYDNRKGSLEFAHAKVEIGEEFAYLAGRYVVYKTSLDGGFMGQGLGDVYPDGYHVFCERIDNRSLKVDFFQSGCFTATIKDIEPVGSVVDDKMLGGSGIAVPCESMEKIKVKYFIDKYGTEIELEGYAAGGPKKSMNDNNTSTTGTPLFALGNGEGLGSFVNYTIQLNPELDTFKQEILKRLKAIPKVTLTEAYQNELAENGPGQDCVQYGKIEKLITWIERGTED